MPANKAALAPSSHSSAPYNLGHRPNPPPGLPLGGQPRSSYNSGESQSSFNLGPYHGQQAHHPPALSQTNHMPSNDLGHYATGRSYSSSNYVNGPMNHHSISRSSSNFSYPGNTGGPFGSIPPPGYGNSAFEGVFSPF